MYITDCMIQSWPSGGLRLVTLKKQEDLSILKGQSHEDFAVLGQFWAKIVTLRLYS